MKWNEAGLFIYRPEVIEPMLARDPAFYRPHGEGIWAAIQRVSPEENGELLGYGARSLFGTEYQVVIFAKDDPARTFAEFTAELVTADRCALDRMSEIEDYIGESLAYVVIER